MQWTNKPNKTPSILEVLEYKAAIIEGLRRCPYRGNKKGHTFLIETEGELQERIKNKTASITERPKEPIEPVEPRDEDEDAKWDRYDHKEKRYRSNVIKYELAEAYDKQLKDLLMSTFPGCANDLLDGGTHLPDSVTGQEIMKILITNSKFSEASRNSGRVIYDRFGDGPTSHKYTPNANGPSAFFQAMGKDLKLAKQLEKVTITYIVAMEILNLLLKSIC